MSRRKNSDFESAMDEDEVSRRMSSTAGRRLQERLRALDLLDEPRQESSPGHSAGD